MYNRNLLVVIKTEFMSERAIEQEVDCINAILMMTESPDHFCMVHELVNRNRITSKKEKILRATRYIRLKPFRFLINKN